MKQITLAFVEDHQLVRQMWMTLFEEMPEVKIAGESGSLAEAIPMITEQQPDIVLLDINLPDASGLDAVPYILKSSPQTRIVAVSMHNQASYARQMLELGARAYVTKNSSPEEIFEAVKAVMRGEQYICEEIRNAN
ncbi:MAG: response regulator transcription factor [Chitinophagaceae bacterium]